VLDSFSTPSFADSPPILLEVRFKNAGTVHEAPQGTIEVRNLFGELSATATLPVRNVLPGVVRKVEASVGSGLWLGRYTVLLHATYGDNGQELVSKQYVWVLPLANGRMWTRQWFRVDVYIRRCSLFSKPPWAFGTLLSLPRLLPNF